VVLVVEVEVDAITLLVLAHHPLVEDLLQKQQVKSDLLVVERRMQTVIMLVGVVAEQVVLVDL